MTWTPAEQIPSSLLTHLIGQMVTIKNPVGNIYQGRILAIRDRYIYYNDGFIPPGIVPLDGTKISLDKDLNT